MELGERPRRYAWVALLAAALLVAAGLAGARGEPAPSPAPGGESPACSGTQGEIAERSRGLGEPAGRSAGPGATAARAGLDGAGAAVRANAKLEALRPGPALRTGCQALRAGQPALAAALFARVAARHPVVADHAATLRVRALLEAGRFVEAEAVGEAALRAHPRSPVRPSLSLGIGRARRSLGDEAGARLAWAEARAASDDPELRAELAAARAASLQREGALLPAARAWLEVWTEHAAHPAGDAAARELAALEERLGAAVRRAADWLRRGEALYTARRNGEALAALDRALEGGLSLDEREAALRRRAFTLFRLRRYPEASRAFARAGEDRALRFWRARALARSGEIRRSIAAFERLAAEGGGTLGERALYLAATLREDEGEADRARAAATYERLAQRGATSALREAALWRLGWEAYREGRPQEAARRLAHLEALEPEPIAALRAAYWRARALERAGDPEGRTRLRAIAAEWPLTYYGWRAAQRVDAPSRHGRGPKAAPEPLSLPLRGLARARILLEAGLARAAAGEVERLWERADGMADRRELAHLFAEAGDPHRAQRVVVDAYRERLARGPEPGREDLWWHAWPLAFAGAVEEAVAPTRGLPRELLYAVMREESGYRPRVTSAVGARGLAQIMPDTGSRLAARLGWSAFHPDALFEPGANLRLSASYLEELLGRFDGRLAPAAGSYNAGPRAVGRWIGERPELDGDEWVEAIPYSQTRRYVKRVLRSVHAYRVLY